MTRAANKLRQSKTAKRSTAGSNRRTAPTPALPTASAAPRCGTKNGKRNGSSIALPVLAEGRTKVRKSRTSKWRAGVLIALHLIIIGHIVHWWMAGRTLSPVEPSEGMYTLNYGHLNAGFLFFAAAIVATLLLGRFVCGWGCHFVAYQDLCLWLLKKIGIKPKPLRSRILVLAPLALALYMFVWPSVYRWWVGYPAPAVTNHLMKADFWETFPGPVVAVLTFVVAGMAIVYFLGAKGFCTYACPYGGFFGLADKVAPGRILVTDDCEHCGHCTAVCTSNVRVHEEVALYGMVVDPGCMKCMDCVSVCPNDALYFGFAKPSLAAKRSSPRRAKAYDFSLAEEVLMVVVGLAALLAFRALYDQIPLLLSMGMAAMTAYLVLKAVHLITNTNVRFQNWQLKGGSRMTRAGLVFLIAFLPLFAFTAHSGAVQYNVWRGRSLLAAAHVGDEVWSTGDQWWQYASAEERSSVDRATVALERADRWGLIPTYTALRDLIWLYLAAGRVDQAEQTALRMIALQPKEPDPYHGWAGILRKKGRVDEAIVQYKRALEVGPDFLPARNELAALLPELGRFDEALALNREVLRLHPPDVNWSLDFGSRLLKEGRFAEATTVLMNILAAAPSTARAHWLLGVALVQLHHKAAGVEHLRTAVQLDPTHAEAQYDLGMALLAHEQTAPAIEHLRQAIQLKGDFATAHYNLAVALAMAGRPAEAMPHAQEAIRLDPKDADARALLEVLREQASNSTQSQP